MYRKLLTSKSFLTIALMAALPSGSQANAEQAKVANIVQPPAALMAKVPPKNPEPVKPPPPPAPELAAMLKQRKGTFKCKGVMMQPDGSSTPMTATMTTKLALGGYWIQTSWNESRSKTPFNFESATTYDALTATWHRLTTDNQGGQEVAFINGPSSGALIWEATSRSFMGANLARHSEEVVGKDIKLWGEFSNDKGVTWMKGYETVCKR
jgi:hypothetical protein